MRQNLFGNIFQLPATSSINHHILQIALTQQEKLILCYQFSGSQLQLYRRFRTQNTEHRTLSLENCLRCCSDQNQIDLCSPCCKIDQYHHLHINIKTASDYLTIMLPSPLEHLRALTATHNLIFVLYVTVNRRGTEIIDSSDGQTHRSPRMEF